jgi:hypothetical protein
VNGGPATRAAKLTAFSVSVIAAVIACGWGFVAGSIWLMTNVGRWAGYVLWGLLMLSVLFGAAYGLERSMDEDDAAWKERTRR